MPRWARTVAATRSSGAPELVEVVADPAAHALRRARSGFRDRADGFHGDAAAKTLPASAASGAHAADVLEALGVSQHGAHRDRRNVHWPVLDLGGLTGIGDVPQTPQMLSRHDILQAGAPGDRRVVPGPQPSSSDPHTVALAFEGRNTPVSPAARRRRAVVLISVVLPDPASARSTTRGCSGTSSQPRPTDCPRRRRARRSSSATSTNRRPRSTVSVRPAAPRSARPSLRPVVPWV